MGTTLNGRTPQNTYPSLIKVGDNGALDANLQTLSDGEGNDLPMQVSTSGVNFTGTLTQNGQPLTTTPSGVAGAIQFSNGSAFASDAANLFWDDTNNRLGVGTNAPTEKITAITSSAADGISLKDASNQLALIGKWFDSSGFFDLSQNGTPYARIQASQSYLSTPFTIGSNTALSARLGIKGSGSTSATTSLLVQNSAGSDALIVRDDLTVLTGGSLTTAGTLSIGSGIIQNINSAIINIQAMLYASNVGNDGVSINTATRHASAILTIESTTKGFLPPRMTTTQKNAIASPAAGLVVYDSTVNRAAVYSTAWENVITETNGSPNSVSKMWSGSQAQYDALTPDSSTIYFIV